MIPGTYWSALLDVCIYFFCCALDLFQYFLWLAICAYIMTIQDSSFLGCLMIPLDRCCFLSAISVGSTDMCDECWLLA